MVRENREGGVVHDLLYDRGVLGALTTMKGNEVEGMEKNIKNEEIIGKREGGRKEGGREGGREGIK